MRSHRGWCSMRGRPQLRSDYMRRFSLTFGIVFWLGSPALGQDGTPAQSGHWGLITAFGCVVVGLILANAFVIALFHAKQSSDSSGLRASWSEKWEFSPQALGGFSWRSLILWSLLSLFFELLVIRSTSLEFRIFAFFKNFVLIACFLGFGLGCYLCRRAVSVAMLAAPLLFMTVLVAVPWPPLRILVRSLPVLPGATSNIQLWGIGASALDY